MIGKFFAEILQFFREKDNYIFHCVVTLPCGFALWLCLAPAFQSIEKIEMGIVISRWSSDSFYAVLTNSTWWASILQSWLLTVAATGISLLLVCSIVTCVFGYWATTNSATQRVCLISLIGILIIAHVHLTFGLGFVFGSQGLLARVLHSVGIHADIAAWPLANGIGYLLVMVGKETLYLLVLASIFCTTLPVHKMLMLGSSLGYNRWQSMLYLLMPDIYTRIKLPLLIVFIFVLSNVEVATLSTQNRQPLIGVLLWEWSTNASFDPLISAQFEHMSAAGGILLLGLVALTIAGFLLLQRCWRSLFYCWIRQGRRFGETGIYRGGLSLLVLLILAAYFLALIMVVWSFVWEWRYPNIIPLQYSYAYLLHEQCLQLLSQSLLIGSVSAFLSLVVVTATFELQRSNKPLHTIIAYIPLILPQIILVPGLYSLTLHTQTSGSYIGLIWSHFFFTMPFQYLLLQQAYKKFDSRYAQTAQLLGKHPCIVWYSVTLPLLLKPLLFAFVLGVTVSFHLFLPTFFIGDGRIQTLMTSLVAQGSSLDRRIIGGLVVWLAVVPFILSILAQYCSTHFFPLMQTKQQ